MRAKNGEQPDLAGTIHYALTLWPPLTRYVDNGRTEIDKNEAERVLRVVTLVGFCKAISQLTRLLA